MKHSLKYKIEKKAKLVGKDLLTKVKNQGSMSRLSAAARKRVKLINGGYNGSEQEYRERVLAYWKRYGLKPDKYWFDLFCNGKTEYDPRFIPNSYWYGYIIPFFNDKSVAGAYSDKGMFHRLLPDVAQPETIVKNIGGYYYNGDKEEIITRQEAIQLCSQEKHLIIKPSRFTFGGKSIRFFDQDVQGEKEIVGMFDELNNNFVAQRLVKQHADLERLNPSSLNTLRVLSFHFRGQVHILSAQLRIGGKGSRVDNVSSGGCACAVQPDGKLHEKAVNRQSVWVDETSTGIKLKDVWVPNYTDVVETIKRLHCQLPYFNILGWDFAVRDDGAPVFIEFNYWPGQNQIGDGEPTFGDITEQVLDEVFIKKQQNTKSNESH